MNAAKTRVVNKKEAQRVRKPVIVAKDEERHIQRNAEKRNKFPKRPTQVTHPFETTFDF